MSLAAISLLLLAASTPLPPEAPRVKVDTAFPELHGRSLFVGGGDDLQLALDHARPGDTISLEAGATFKGPFTLPGTKDRSGWIVVRTSAPNAALPPPGARLDPAKRPPLARLTSGRGPVITAAPGAQGWRLVGLEITPEPGAELRDVVVLGSGRESKELLPSRLIIDRCWVHGDPVKGARRGIDMNAASAAVIDSWVSGIGVVGDESQAIAAWSTPGPLLVENSYLEAAGENLLIGGADPPGPDRIPSDISVLHNSLVKLLAWKPDDPAFAGQHFGVKNLLELKAARRVLIEGNLLENCWADAQNGFAILFTVRNQQGGAPFSVVEDVMLVSNVVRGAGGGVNILGHDKSWPSGSGRVSRVRISNDLFLDIGGPRWRGTGALFQLLEGSRDVAIDHVTAFQTGNSITADGEPHQRFSLVSSVFQEGTWGIAGTGTAPGIATLAAYFPGAIMNRNVVIGGVSGRYPPGTDLPATPAAAGIDPSSGHFSVQGRGVDTPDLASATGGAIGP